MLPVTDGTGTYLHVCGGGRLQGCAVELLLALDAADALYLVLGPVLQLSYAVLPGPAGDMGD